VSDQNLPSEILQHYANGRERGRLFAGTGPLELERTKELIARFLPPPPRVVLDVGGGTGVYARWLSGEGYETHLIDPVPLHVEQAQSGIASAMVGDARSLERGDQSVDAVLLLGPLYHLVEREDRIAALREARRVLVEGGLVFAAGISRFASMLDGLNRRLIDDPAFERIVEQDLSDGQHRNTTDNPSYFTTAYFHLPEELAEEMREAGLRTIGTFAVEGPAWLLSNFEERWGDEDHRRRMLNAIRRVETEASLIGASAHILGVGSKS
jgi:ubiquinone/menaquinone biosynthesis C-methylase UbiE